VCRVLILTASFGAGHDQAAHAVRESLEKLGAIVEVIDYVQWLHPAVRRFAKFGLIHGVKTTPNLYGLFYRSLSYIPISSPFNKRLNSLGISHLKKCIESFNPDAVAGTFPTPMGGMSELRASGFTSIPNATILTDYTAHPQWVHEHTDMYFVATESVKNELMELNVPETRIVVSGIPIRSKFDEEATTKLLSNRDTLRKKYNFDPTTPLILMMGGGEGIFAGQSVCEQIVSMVDAQFAIICGRNESLYKRMLPLGSKRIRVLGYVEEVNEWMAMSDLMVTKAGGITVTEAFAMELPMLIYRPIPGQEEQNALFAVRSGAAEVAYDVQSAVKFLESIVKEPSRLVTMRQAAQKQANRNAANKIAAAILELIANHSNDVKTHRVKA
jgi:processive 1,2-diacylglycerol beta-glucosyltransferase